MEQKKKLNLCLIINVKHLDNSYIRVNNNNFSRKLTLYKGPGCGAPKTHHQNVPIRPLTRDILTNITKKPQRFTQ